MINKKFYIKVEKDINNIHKVLVIDDEEDILNIISIYLTGDGYDVVTAKDGEEGLRRFDESSFDLVITDLIMPHCHGIDIARYVCNAGRNIPVIGITGTPWDFDLSCFDVVISKPFSFEEFMACIAEVMSTREGTKTN